MATFTRRTTNTALAARLREIAGDAGLTETRLSLADGEALQEAARRLREIDDKKA